MISGKSASTQITTIFGSIFGFIQKFVTQVHVVSCCRAFTVHEGRRIIRSNIEERRVAPGK